jgi:hypothetical protein
MLRVLLTLITIGVTIYAFVDCLRSSDAEVRALPRPLWLLVILVPLVGGLAWLAFGRARTDPAATGPIRVLAPDDDPDFLQSLDLTFRERRRQATDDARRHREEEPRPAQDVPPGDEDSPGDGAPGTTTGNGTPGTGRPGPGTGKPGTARPGTSKPGTSKPGTSKPGTGKPNGAPSPGSSGSEGD